MTPTATKNALLYKNLHSHPAALITSVSGIHLTTSDGRKIIDATSGPAVACLGYDDKDVQQAIIDQLKTVPYCHPGFYKTQAADDLANFLVESTNGQMSKAVLCGTGSTPPKATPPSAQNTAAGLRVQRVIEERGLVAHAKEVGGYLGRRLREVLMGHPYVGDVRGRGLFWAVEFVVDKGSKMPFPASLEVHAKLHARGMQRGYEVALFNAAGGYDGYRGGHFLVCPPFIVTRADVDEIVERTVRVVEDTFCRAGWVAGVGEDCLSG
ncbi:pyridoxal phosphate-dependent transferase [Podospora conica]|nr:pyridoxal phosphate-dependent transferase [Schizothecium conicum]